MNYSPVVYVGAGAVKTSGAGNITGVALPAFKPGDIFACLSATADNIVQTYPAGWIKKLEANAGSFCRATLAWKRAQLGDTAFTITRALGDSGVARVFLFRNCIEYGDPFFDAQLTSTSASLTVSAPDTQSPGPGSLAIFCGGVVNHSSPADTSSTYIFATPSGSNPGWTKRSADTDGSGLAADYAGLGLFTGAKNDVGGLGARTSLLSGGYLAANTLNVGMMLTLLADPGVRVPTPQLVYLRRNR